MNKKGLMKDRDGSKGQDIVSIVDEILKKAVSYSASDVHFEPTETGLDVKFRLDGVLSVFEKLPKSLSDNVISRLKVIGGLLTYRTDIPQARSAKRKYPGWSPARGGRWHSRNRRQSRLLYLRPGLYRPGVRVGKGSLVRHPHPGFGLRHLWAKT